MQHEEIMREVVSLALQGQGHTSPNPLVGAIVVGEDGIISKGYHKYAGTPHAEIWALEKAGDKAKGSTLYVNLEPCCHHGRTGPCTQAIIQAGVSRVVVGALDPNPQVQGKGIQELRESGIEVITGVLKDECIDLNKKFFHWVCSEKPWITVKIATTLNGKIAQPEHLGRYITGPESKQFVHGLRLEHDAVLVGSGTVKADNPQLTVREVPGRNPLRIVLDRRGSLEDQYTLFQDQAASTIVYSMIASSLPEWVERRNWNGGLGDLLGDLGSREVVSVLVEAGPTLASQFICEGLFNELILMANPERLVSDDLKTWYSGDTSLELTLRESKFLGKDLMLRLCPN